MDTLGLIECKSIAAGSACVDAMLKVAEIKLIKASPICPGKYMIYVAGDREAVQTAIDFARNSGIKIMASAVISNISKEIINSLRNRALEKMTDINAIGVIETSVVTASIELADEIIKTVNVRLARLNLAQGIAGKGYFVICGDLASVQEAINLAQKHPKLIDAVSIARPEAEVIKILLGRVK